MRSRKQESVNISAIKYEYTKSNTKKKHRKTVPGLWKQYETIR